MSTHYRVKQMLQIVTLFGDYLCQMAHFLLTDELKTRLIDE